MFRKGQKIHVAVCVSSDSVNGGWVVTEEEGSEYRKCVGEDGAGRLGGDKFLKGSVSKGKALRPTGCFEAIWSYF